MDPDDFIASLPDVTLDVDGEWDDQMWCVLCGSKFQESTVTTVVELRSDSGMVTQYGVACDACLIQHGLLKKT